MTAPPEWIRTVDLRQWLTPDEMAVCAEAGSERRRLDKLAGRLAVKRLIGETFGIAPAAYTVASDGLAPILKPLPGEPPIHITISLSHSAGLGAASWAWAETQGSVGVDAQHIRPVKAGLEARAFTGEEREHAAQVPEGTLLIWALKEAAIKARRQTWGRALREVVVTLDQPMAQAGTAAIAVSGEPPMAAWYARQGEWWVARAVQTAQTTGR